MKALMELLKELDIGLLPTAIDLNINYEEDWHKDIGSRPNRDDEPRMF